MPNKRRNILVLVLSVMIPALFIAGCGPNLVDRVSNFWTLGCCGGVIVILDIIALLEIVGSTRSASNKVLWALLIIFFPLGGLILYYLFGRE